MNELVLAVVATAGALGGASLAGWFTLRAGAVERRAREAGELAAVVSAVNHALDRLELELRQLPPDVASRSKDLTDRALERTPLLAWAIAQASRHTVGRPAMLALDGYSAAASRLLLAGPEPVLHALAPINDLLADVEHRDGEWWVAWRGARGELIRVARVQTVVNDKGTPITKRRPGSRSITRSARNS
ncbi:hypothetical protein [Paraconexibacter algicola]|uniref:Uncharacterized protein n=1 Tax=Paraconexibacter algicola TaxID=2133960 RepID=A0A2T4ULX3_9ACTN|nr:hypothetical protein [Paraconexibacter algicola]PTL60247.1 hypothetical protein C7Y72_11665 [Paraconexibacter algicola]